MRAVAVLVGIMAVGLAGAAGAADRIRLAQTSVTTNCMMTCNAQAATCQSTCFVPPTPPVGTTTPPLLQAQQPGPTVTASTTCVIGCTNAQLQCQTQCARSASQGLQLTAPPTPTAGTQEVQ